MVKNQPAIQECYICDDWCMLALMTDSYNTRIENSDDVVTLGGFPEDVDAELPFVGDNINGVLVYFSKFSLTIWRFMVHILLMPGLKNFEHYSPSVR